MSNDLISRSTLLEEILKEKEFLQKELGKDADAYMSADFVVHKVNAQPTAYDMDKVIEQINNLDIEAILRYKRGAFGDYERTDYYIKKSDVLEILKAGLIQ